MKKKLETGKTLRILTKDDMIKKNMRKKSSESLANYDRACPIIRQCDLIVLCNRFWELILMQRGFTGVEVD